MSHTALVWCARISAALAITFSILSIWLHSPESGMTAMVFIVVFFFCGLGTIGGDRS